MFNKLVSQITFWLFLKIELILFHECDLAKLFNSVNRFSGCDVDCNEYSASGSPLGNAANFFLGELGYH